MDANSYTERKLPFSLEAEQAVIGSVLISPASLDKITGIITFEDFYIEEHGLIYSAMQGMYLKSKNIDNVTLVDELVAQGAYSDAQTAKNYLYLIVESVPVASNVVDYANIVRDKSILRSLITSCENIIEAAYTEEGEVNRLLEKAESDIYRIAEQHENKSFVHIRDSIVSVYANLQELINNREEVEGVKTGFSDLDKVIVGMGKSDLILVGARPGMGKTAFALNVASAVAKKSKKAVCIFSLEMSAEQLTMRLLSSEALIDSYKMRAGELDGEWDKLAQASSTLSECNILIDDTSGQTVAGIMSKLRRIKNLGLVVIDYLGLMQSEHHNDNRVQEVSEISRNLKLLAKEFEVPVVCCAQLSRGPESRTDKRPMLSDLRDSGAIEQDADVVMFLYRDEYYKESDDAQSVAEIIIAKNRHGSTGKVKVGWSGKYTRFMSLENDIPENPS